MHLNTASHWRTSYDNFASIFPLILEGVYILPPKKPPVFRGPFALLQNLSQMSAYHIITLKKEAFVLQTSLLPALLGTGFTFLMTAAGSSVVFFFSKEIPDKLQRTFLGFASGVMIAASIWSLLIPAIDQAESYGIIGWIPAAIGFLAGALFLLLLERHLPHLAGDWLKASTCSFSLHRNLLLLFAITLHNIPEGMAVGLAWPLAIGIGIQNFPEGAAVSLPLRKNGLSRTKAFLLGSATGVVEPLFGILAVMIASQAQACMPWLLSLAAGAMIYVVVEELIPEAHLGERSTAGTLGVIIGFLLMMILDVSLG